MKQGKAGLVGGKVGDGGLVFFSFPVKKNHLVCRFQSENLEDMLKFTPVREGCFPAMDKFFGNLEASKFHLPSLPYSSWPAVNRTSLSAPGNAELPDPALQRPKRSPFSASEATRRRSAL